MTGEKSMGTRVGMEHAQERPHDQLSTSHTHINIPTCGVLFIIPSQSDCIWNPITTTLTGLSQNTTCRDIYVGVTCGQLDMRSFSIPTLVAILFFTSQSSLHFLQ